jgi:DNA repair protein RadD
MRPLRPYQQHALELLRQSLGEGHRRPILQLPTGSGKTICAASIIHGALDRSKRLVFVVPRLVLIDQTVRSFERDGITDIGVIQGDHPRRNPSARVQIASAQTLIRRELPQVDGVIVDEVHLRFDKIEQWIISPEGAGIIFIGLSATPWARGMAQIWDDLIKPVSIQELIDDGHLCRFRVFVEAAPDMSGVRTLGGDYREDDLSAISGAIELNANVISTWLEKGENRPTICYAVDRAHGRNLTNRFLEAHVAAEFIDCETPQDEREAIFTRYTAGATRVLVNVATLDTGLDLDVHCICDCRPTKSRVRFVQAIGRGLRIADGKKDLLILDHAGNHTRLGAVTRINVRNLLKGNEPEEKKAIREPEDMTGTLGGPKGVHELDGKLIELDLVAKATVEPHGEREIFYSMLVHYGRSRGYKAGWATVNFFERFGHYPPAKMRSLAPMQPDDETMTWILAQLRAYALRASRGEFAEGSKRANG